MAFLYEIIILGAPTDEQITALQSGVQKAVAAFGLVVGEHIGWNVCPEDVSGASDNVATVAAFFGREGVSTKNVETLLRRSIPILPISTTAQRVAVEIPEALKPLNCLYWADVGSERATTALLECVGLLPRQRRIFVSYRRDEARGAALQLFDALSARLFDVFIDTHGISLADEFQAMLWHRLCDSDVLLMLDTPTYFSSRWTSAEFGRALAKGISVLRIGWPDFHASPRTATASTIALEAKDVDQESGKLSSGVIDQIFQRLEVVRSESVAVRSLNLASNLRFAAEKIGGKFLGVGPHRAMYLSLPNKEDLVVYPTVGVPTSLTLHEAESRAAERSSAVVFDHIGLHPSWLAHLDWLGSHIPNTRWVKSTEAAWQFADWN